MSFNHSYPQRVAKFATNPFLEQLATQFRAGASAGISMQTGASETLLQQHGRKIQDGGVFSDGKSNFEGSAETAQEVDFSAQRDGRAAESQPAGLLVGQFGDQVHQRVRFEGEIPGREYGDSSDGDGVE